MSSIETYLTAVSSSTSSGSRPARRAAAAISSRRGRRSARARIETGQVGHASAPTTPACRPVTPLSRRCEKNSPAPAHIVHRPVVHLLDPGFGERVARDGGQVEVALAGAGTRNARERRVHLLVDLVAAPRARPDHGCDLARRRRARAPRPRPRRRSPPASPRRPPCSAATAPSATSITGSRPRSPVPPRPPAPSPARFLLGGAGYVPGGSVARRTACRGPGGRTGSARAAARPRTRAARGWRPRWRRRQP